MNTPIKLLNHGYIRLVDHMGSDLSIVRSARVSYDAEPRQDGSDEKLIRYLMNNRHTTPFESVVFTFEVKAPIFVFRQWHRHRTWSYNEVSARYTQLPDEMYKPDPDNIGVQSKINKQSRDIGDVNHFTNKVEDHFDQIDEKVFKTYKRLIAENCPRELARAILPVGTYSKMFATVNLHNLFHFIRLRIHPHAQYEIRVYAEAMMELISKIVPIATSAFKETLES